MDISETLQPASDQLDAIDLQLLGPQTYTVESVSKGNAEQPVQVKLKEFPRVWRPSKGMRRVLAACWGTDASAWAGRRVRLFCDPEVFFGKEKTGGVRIEALSDIDGPQSVPMLVSRGRSSTYTVQPLIDSPAAFDITPESVAACESIPTLRDWYKQVQHKDAKAAIQSRIKQLEAAALGESDANL